jgi:hypothetical protein
MYSFRALFTWYVFSFSGPWLQYANCVRCVSTSSDKLKVRLQSFSLSSGALLAAPDEVAGMAAPDRVAGPAGLAGGCDRRFVPSSDSMLVGCGGWGGEELCLAISKGTRRY